MTDAHVGLGTAALQGSIPGTGRSSGEGNGNPLQYPCQENSMARGAWGVTVLGVPRVRHDLVTKPPPHNSYRFSAAALCWVEKVTFSS